MTHTFSAMLPLGTKATNFKLMNVISGEFETLNSLKSDIATVIMFICNHCPYVKHINTELSNVATDYITKGISFIAISSNDADSFPNDAPEKLKEQAEEFNFNFPYLYDDSQMVAKAYKAACTPDFFVYNGDLELVYRGQFDQSSPKNDIPVSGRVIREVLENILKGQPINSEQIPSSGCNIKWKAGVSPF